MDTRKINSEELMKKAFILYLDQQELFNKLPDEIAGKLIKHIFSYVNLEKPEAEDLLLEVAFSSIKQTLKRDLNKWESQLKQRSLAGKKSAEKRANEKQRKATTVESRSTNPTVSVSDSVSVSVSVKEKTKAFDAFWDNYPKKTDRKKAMVSFNRLNKTNADLATKDCSIRFNDTEKRYIPHATTYLNGERWNDELPNGVVEEKKGYFAGIRYET